jgi:ketosteroid isomerase-like protein
VVGHAALAIFWQGVFDSGIGGAVLETLELSGDENGLTEFGQFTLKTKDGSVADRGSFIVIWRQEGGQWKLHRDMFTSSGPLL